MLECLNEDSIFDCLFQRIRINDRSIRHISPPPISSQFDWLLPSVLDSAVGQSLTVLQGFSHVPCNLSDQDFECENLIRRKTFACLSCYFEVLHEIFHIPNPLPDNSFTHHSFQEGRSRSACFV